MDVQEFKTKYPHLSHLEGDDLWNAMEDAWIIEHKDDKPKQIIDWKGNVIKDGDEICVIKVVDKQIFRFIGFIVGGKTIGTPEPERPDKRCWEVGEYITVEPGLKYTRKVGEYTMVMPLSMLVFGINTDTHILAIKGVSDMNDGSADR